MVQRPQAMSSDMNVSRLDGSMVATSGVNIYRDTIRSHFEAMAADREHWIQLNRHYYEDLERFYRSVIPRGSRVLEIGSGTGDLLAAVEPSYGVGIDFSPAFVGMARQRHPGLTFMEMDAANLDITEKF